MAHGSGYSDFHPRWYRRPVSTLWWLESWSYFVFMLREISCVFVGWAVVFLLTLVRAVGDGEPAYQAFLAWSATPSILVLNITSLLFILFHAVTFFGAATTIVVVRLGDKRVPGSLILAAHYGGLVALSAAIFLIVMGG